MVVAKFVGVRLADPYTDEVIVEGKLSSLDPGSLGYASDTISLSLTRVD